MRNHFLFSVAGIFCFVLVLVSCQNDPLEPEFGAVQLKFDNVVGKVDLELDSTATYTNGSGELFSVTKLNYFVSNIKLKKADGSQYVVPQDSSYFLVSESDLASQTITLPNVPVDDYTSVSFVLGVDAERNRMEIGKRTGVLDPAGTAAGMYWDWNTGYIFLKLEGTSPKARADTSGKQNFAYHIGLYGGYVPDPKAINNVKNIQLSVGAGAAQVVAGGITNITIKADVLKIFDGVKPVSIAKNPNVMIVDFSKTIANNYATMFSIGNIQIN